MTKAIWVLLLLAGSAIADEVYVFPADGQSAEQQEKDKFECYQWAAEQSGYDPVADSSGAPDLASADKTESSSSNDKTGKPALGGAAKGAVIAEVSDGDAGKGAAAGAAMGVLKGKRQQQSKEDQEREAAAKRARLEAEAKQRELRANYARANAACLEGRGYTVK